MSKLTREVKYLQESDRPKKAEPLSFLQWCRERGMKIEESYNNWRNDILNDRATEYATYLQEFNADEKPVELVSWMCSNNGWVKTDFPDETKSITYLGKCAVDGDIFLSIEDTTLNIYKGHLNSGRY